MFVTKNKMYKELCEIMKIVLRLSVASADQKLTMDHIADMQTSLHAKLCYLERRIEALESKKQHKTKTKTTKKKGK